MGHIHFSSTLLTTVLLLIALFTASVKLFFTEEELSEMGIRLEPNEIDMETALPDIPLATWTGENPSPA